MPEIAIIFSFILVVVIVLTFGINSIVGKNFRHKQWLEEHRSSNHGKASDEKHEALEERVRVLERIATDNNEPLAAQIEQLRDLHSADASIQAQEKTT